MTRRSFVIALFVIAVVFLSGRAPSAYIGDSFMKIPGIDGGWSGQTYKSWIRVEANYWNSETFYWAARRSRDRTKFSISAAPPVGPDALVISVDKRSPALAPMMDRCRKGTTIPEVTYAESADRARARGEIGPRPADVPEYLEYRLTNVILSDCPVLADAPAQAFFVSFDDIHWTNFENTTRKAAALKPAVLPPLPSTGKTKAFVLTWFGVAHDVAADQCPILNKKPSEDDYYALMSREEAATERSALSSKGLTVGYENEQMAFRGPHRLNACMLPGIVRDPGNAAPQTSLARGFDLDGDDGTGSAPAGACRHKNYMSADGRRGIDNQLFTVQGCMAGYQGRKGFLQQYLNEQRRNGKLSMLMQVSGIDNDQSDDSVEVTLLYSLDPMAKNGAGTAILGDYSFRVTDSIEYTPYFARLHGRIVNGVVTTDPVKMLKINPSDQETFLAQARVRLEFLPDGSMKGLIGGYQDWRDLMVTQSNNENLYGFQCPAFYGALKHSADGLKDPVTGECNGISSAFDIEGVPAFIAPSGTESKGAAPARTTARR